MFRPSIYLNTSSNVLDQINGLEVRHLTGARGMLCNILSYIRMFIVLYIRNDPTPLLSSACLCIWNLRAPVVLALAALFQFLGASCYYITSGLPGLSFTGLGHALGCWPGVQAQVLIRRHAPRRPDSYPVVLIGLTMLCKSKSDASKDNHPQPSKHPSSLRLYSLLSFYMDSTL